MTGASVAGALAWAQRLGIARLDAQLLLGHLLQRGRAWLIANDGAALTVEQARAFAASCERRAAGEPLAYLVGEKEFHGLVLEVDAAVLVPRPDTELLVDWALELLRSGAFATPRPAVVDLGTGSGALALALKHAAPQIDACATDASAAALDVAHRNARRHALEVAFVRGSWWAPLGGRRFDLALSNPPYVAEGDPHLAALRHEPRVALTPGGDGLGALREIVTGAHAHLRPGGWLLLEHGHDQAGAVASMLGAAGFTLAGSRPDLAGHLRCTGGRMP
jgi:release factor glutamine methyltransferase